MIAAAADFVSAFDKTDPTLTAARFIKVGIRSSLIPILISYMSDRKMIVKFRGAKSDPKNLVGGGPQGTLLGGLQYLISSDECSQDKVKVEDRFRFYDDLNIIEFIILTDLLIDYDFFNHVASDICIDKKFLPPQCYKLQEKMDDISLWTRNNLMKINESKSNYIIYSRSKDEFTTRLKLNDASLERISVIKLLGVWIEEDISWTENTKQICKRAFTRIHMLSKLKYAGISVTDLLIIYKLFIRSIVEYCSTVFHTALTQNKLNR